MSEARKYTVRLMEAMDEGLLSPEEIAKMALMWLSEADVKEMVLANDLSSFLLYEGEDEDEDE